MSNLVAIVGRPNVGKSTLFNRLTRSRQAIVTEEAGTTRDRQYGHVTWCERTFSIVDTGGWVLRSDDVFEEEINKQVRIAVEEADLILFVVDILNGVTDLDDEIALMLRQTNKPVILVANKADNHPAQRRCGVLLPRHWRPLPYLCHQRLLNGRSPRSYLRATP